MKWKIKMTVGRN